MISSGGLLASSMRVRSCFFKNSSRMFSRVPWGIHSRIHPEFSSWLWVCPGFLCLLKFLQWFPRKFLQRIPWKYLHEFLSKFFKDFIRVSLEVIPGIYSGNSLIISSCVVLRSALKFSTGISSKVPFDNYFRNFSTNPFSDPLNNKCEISTGMRSSIPPLMLLEVPPRIGFRNIFRRYFGNCFL